MGDIPGVKGFRLMEGQPVALGPFGADFSQGKRHRLEVTFDDGSIQNIDISETSYKGMLSNLARQGVGIEQRLVARAVVASEESRTVVAEKVMPLDVTPQEALETLKEVGKPAPEPPKLQPTERPVRWSDDDLFYDDLELFYDEEDD